MLGHRLPVRSKTHRATTFRATRVSGAPEALVLALALAGCASPPPAEPAAPVVVRAPDYRRGQHVYRLYCASCHDGANVEAPPLDDIEAWDERAFDWESVLTLHAVQGFLEMPPDSALSEESINDALLYMETRIRAIDEQSRNDPERSPESVRSGSPDGARHTGPS